MAYITFSTPPGAMKKDLTPLVNTLREIAYDAGCALLLPVDADTTRRYAARYNTTSRQLGEAAPWLAASVAPLPGDATAGAIRIAARAAVARAGCNPMNCYHRLAA